MKPTKPTIDDILQFYEDSRKRYDESGVYKQFERDDDFYELDFKKDLMLPEEFKSEGIALPTARDIVDTCVDHTSISNVRVYVNRKSTSQKSDEESELLRKFGLGVLYRNNVEASISPIRVAAKHYWMHGLAVIKDVWDADRYLDKPDRDEGEDENTYATRIDEWRAEQHDSIPIVLQSINPKNILLDPYYDGGMYVFEVREDLAINVMDKYPKWRNPGHKRITEKVEHISFWTKDWRCEMYDKEPVLKGGVVKHSYGFIPYVPIDTGLGNISADNDLTKRYVGILRYIRDLLISESRDYSIGDVILKRTAFPWGYLKGPNADQVKNIYQKFGEYNPMPEGVEIVDMAPKMPPGDLLSWMGVANQYLGAHGAPNSVRGLGETGVRSGADRRLLLAEAASRYTYSNEAFKHGIAKVLSNCARIMKNVVPGDISVWARTPTDEFDIEIQKDKMKEPFTFYVEFSDISEEDDYRKHDDLERMVNSHIVTPDWAWKQMNNVDPKQMRREFTKEEIRQSPSYKQARDMFVTSLLVQKLAALQMKNKLDQPATPITQPTMGGVSVQNAPPPISGQSTSPPQGNMTVGVPNVAPLGSAQNIQNNMRNQRSQTPMYPGQGRGGGGSRQ